MLAMMRFKSCIAAIVALLTMSCTAHANQSSTNNQNETNMKKDGKTRVVFFSHAGENYSVGNIEVGNTKIVADYISEMTGADQFEIVADKDYDMPYMQLIEVAKQEAHDGRWWASWRIWTSTTPSLSAVPCGGALTRK